MNLAALHTTIATGTPAQALRAMQDYDLLYRRTYSRPMPAEPCRSAIRRAIGALVSGDTTISEALLYIALEQYAIAAGSQTFAHTRQWMCQALAAWYTDLYESGGLDPEQATEEQVMRARILLRSDLAAFDTDPRRFKDSLRLDVEEYEELHMVLKPKYRCEKDGFND